MGRHCSELLQQTEAKHNGKKCKDLHSGVVGTRSTTSSDLLGSGLASGSRGVDSVLLRFLLLSLSNGLGILLIFVYRPVEDIVVLETFTNKEIAEDLAEVRVVRLVIEAKGSGVVEVDGKLIREATAENLGGRGHLLLHDTIVLLLLCSSLQSLPRKGSTAEVEHDIAQGFHVVTARLLCTLLTGVKLEQEREGNVPTPR
jgi:hypothetical protein